MSLALEKNPYGVKWELFDPTEREWIEKLVNAGQYDDIPYIDTLQLTPEKEVEIMKIQAQFRPRSFQFQSTVQQDFEVFMEQNGQTITPELEKEWQDKMDAEREEHLERAGLGSKEKAIAVAVDGTNVSAGVLSNSLTTIKGLSEKSIAKLNEANIYSVEDFKKMPYGDKEKVLGPNVSNQFKNL